MRIGILGSGGVAQTLGSALITLGHEVRLGARDASNERVRAWAEREAEPAGGGTFVDVAAFADQVALNCTAGAHSLEALEGCREALQGKILVDVANPLDFSQGMPPLLTVTNTDSLGERIQRGFPDTRVVKALNTVNHEVMVDPGRIPGAHTLFLCGDDAEAKARVRGWLGEWFGWPDTAFVDLGGIRAARATEAYLLLWVHLMQVTGTSDVSVRVVHP
jgi:hypothetical protein